MVEASLETEGHSLLLRLAGRMPQRWLWRYRDWLANGSVGPLAQALPLTLLRERIALTGEEFAMLVDSFGGDVASGWLLGIEQTSVAPLPRCWFRTTPPVSDAFELGDPAITVLTAVLTDHSAVLQWWMRWRHDDSENAPQRMVLIRASDRPAQLTGQVQRVLRALGERHPIVEVFTAEKDLTSYHAMAFDAEAHVAEPEGVR